MWLESLRYNSFPVELFKTDKVQSGHWPLAPGHTVGYGTIPLMKYISSISALYGVKLEELNKINWLHFV